MTSEPTCTGCVSHGWRTTWASGALNLSLAGADTRWYSSSLVVKSTSRSLDISEDIFRDCCCRYNHSSILRIPLTRRRLWITPCVRRFFVDILVIICHCLWNDLRQSYILLKVFIWSVLWTCTEFQWLSCLIGQWRQRDAVFPLLMGNNDILILPCNLFIRSFRPFL